MTTFHNRTAFVGAWRDDATLAGQRYLGNGTQSAAAVASKCDHSPVLDRINHDICDLTSGKAAFQAALIGFYGGAAAPSRSARPTLTASMTSRRSWTIDAARSPADLRATTRVGGER